MSAKIILETPRLILREVLESDADAFFEMDSNPEVARYVGNVPVSSREQSLETIRFVRQQYRDFGIGRWAVVIRETGVFAGWCGLKRMKDFPVNGVSDHVDIGYRFSRQHWGKGYATESASAVLQYGFRDLGFAEIFAFAVTANTASMQVLTKIGMQRKNEFDYEGDACTWFEARKK